MMLRRHLSDGAFQISAAVAIQTWLLKVPIVDILKMVGSMN